MILMFWCFKAVSILLLVFYSFLLFFKNYFLKYLLITFDLLNQILSLTNQFLS